MKLGLGLGAFMALMTFGALNYFHNYFKGTDIISHYKPLPETPPFSQDLLDQFDQKYEELGRNYRPHTQHKTLTGKARYTNRLFLETNPYLLQHAHNPVNWHPWSEATLELAKKQDKPIFLSIGYSTCHWCHIMKEESFENMEIASYLNEHFISIKVDREERPDVDAVYMSAVQAMTGSGGWPLNIWLTPQGKPFYGGTYFPPKKRTSEARIGFLPLLEKLTNLYATKKSQLETNSEKLTQSINAFLSPPSKNEKISDQLIDQTVQHHKKNFDAIYGGTPGAPKFANTYPLRLLIRAAYKKKDQDLNQQITHTLTQMRHGGIYDQVGGGFHRYSIDEKWRVPHFEKMLYNNALLATTYLEAHLWKPTPLFENTALDILNYILNEMTSQQGAYFSATNADSLAPNGLQEEGYFFTWSQQELQNTLSPKEHSLVKSIFSTTKKGNFEGRNVLFMKKPLAPTQTKPLQSILKKLHHERQKRPKPFRDNKIITSWNGLMISAMALAYRITQEDKYLSSAQSAARFIINTMTVQKGEHKGRLYRSHYKGHNNHYGFLDDYSFFITALIDLYQADMNFFWLEKAFEYDQILFSHFEDQQSGGFFMTADFHESLIARSKPFYDGGEPSGNSYAFLNLLKMHKLTGQKKYLERAQHLVKAFGPLLKRNPISMSDFLVGLDFHSTPIKEVFIITPTNNKASEFKNYLASEFLPHVVFGIFNEDQIKKVSQHILPLKGKTLLNKRPTAYVCENHICQRPTNDFKVFKKQLRQ